MAVMFKSLVLLSLALVLIVSCDDSKPTNGKAEYFYYFPNTVGMLWKYEVYDSLAHSRDTVWVSVTNSVNSTASWYSRLWKKRWLATGRFEQLAVLMHGDTVDFLTDSMQGSTVTSRFVLPLNLGKQWTGPAFADTSVVTDYGDFTVPAGTFNQVSRVNRSWNHDFEGGGNFSITWVSLTKGILYHHLFESYSDGGMVRVTVNQTWKLFDYDFSTFHLAEFRNRVGDEWVYQLVVDTITGLGDTVSVTDTVAVTIVDKVRLSWADSATLWQYIGRELTDTLYTAVIGNEIRVLQDTTFGAGLKWHYEFPMAVGQCWGLEPWECNPAVDDKGPVSSPAGDFRGFHYTMLGGGLNDYWWVDDWLVPGVGTVVRKYRQFGFWPEVSQEWTLLSFTPNNDHLGPI